MGELESSQAVAGGVDVALAGAQAPVHLYPIRAVLDQVPWTTFTEPEVAHVGLTEQQARDRHGHRIEVTNWPMAQVDRALTDGASAGFIKLVHQPNGRLLGATVVSRRAGEMIHEWTLALDQGRKVGDLADSIHVYPTYSMANMQVSSQL